MWRVVALVLCAFLALGCGSTHAGAGAQPPETHRALTPGEQFLDFARGRGDISPVVDGPVELFMGGVFVKTIAADRASDRRAWQGCPAGRGYAARSCPISALEPFADYRGRVEVTDRAPHHPCAHPRPLPGRLSAYHRVTLTPAASLDCTSYFAAQLLVDPHGRIVAVNLVLAEP